MSKESPRKSIRFPADENSVVWVSDNIASPDGRDGIVGLVVNESRTGFNAIFKMNDFLTPKTTVRAAVGKLDCTLAEVRWVTELDEEVVRVGFELKV